MEVEIEHRTPQILDKYSNWMHSLNPKQKIVKCFAECYCVKKLCVLTVCNLTKLDFHEAIALVKVIKKSYDVYHY